MKNKTKEMKQLILIGILIFYAVALFAQDQNILANLNGDFEMETDDDGNQRWCNYPFSGRFYHGHLADRRNLCVGG